MTNILYKDSGFEPYYESVKGQKILLVGDYNTAKYMPPYIKAMEKYCEPHCLVYEDKELIPNEKAISLLTDAAADMDGILCFGSGTLNDLGKYVSFNLKLKHSTLATAPSMDGYVSTVAAIMLEGKKLTLDAKAPDYILVAPDVLSTAPSTMLAAGIGDVLGKYTSLLDWVLANAKNGEEINEEAYNMTLKAVDACEKNLDNIFNRNEEGVLKLMDALLISGKAMAIAGNSRPASGGEHHTSHYLEMYFASHGLPIPLHGLKVGLGTMVTNYIYRYLKAHDVKFKGSEIVYEQVDKLPDIDSMRNLLKKLNAPYKYSDLGISKELLKEMLLNAYTVRTRYTVLTLCHELDIMEKISEEIIEKFY